MSAFEEIYKKVNQAKKLTLEQVRGVIELMVKVQLDSLQEEQLFNAIAKKSEFGKSALKKEHSRLRTEIGLPPTDLGTSLAKAVLEQEFQNGNLINVPTMGLFMYDGVKWLPLSDKQLEYRIFPLVSNQKVLFPKRSVKSVVSEVVSCLKCIVHQYQPEQTLVPIINTQGYELHLKKTGMFTLKYNVPDSFQFSVLPFTYDKNAKAPLYEETMLNIFSKCKEPENVLRHFNEFLGYLMQCERFVPSVWFFHGGGQDGKSTAYSIIKELIGNSAHNCDMQLFQRDNFRYRALLNKLLVVDEDYKNTLDLDTGFLKKQSENSHMNARSPHKLDTLEFKNTALPLLIGNYYPRCTDTSLGWRRRVYVFPFNRKFVDSEVDPDRFEKIRVSEMPGVLNAALRGYARLRQRGDKFDVPEDCRNAKELFLQECYPLLLYLRTRLEKATGDFSYVLLPDLREDMSNWLLSNGYKDTVPYKTLKGELESLGYEVGLVNGVSALKGHTLLKNDLAA